MFISRPRTFKCAQCGKVVADIRKHVEEAHGFIREGAQVFKRHYCETCGKPALYVFGVRYFCGDHKQYAKEVLKTRHAAIVVMVGEAIKSYDSAMKELDRSKRHHRARGRRKRSKA